MSKQAEDVLRIPFCVEELDELHGKTIIGTWTEMWPRLLLVFSDRTAAIIEEDTSGCYYQGEHGGMMLGDPSEYEDCNERAKAMEIWNAYEAANPTVNGGTEK